MVSKEGFDIYGLDLSSNALSLGEEMLQNWGVSANLVNSSMTDIPFEDGYFDVIFDVFSSYCLNMESLMSGHLTAFKIPKLLYLSIFPSLPLVEYFDI